MTGINTFILLSLSIFIFCFSSLMAQGKEKSYENRDKAENSISKFNSAYFNDKDFKHAILYFNIKEGDLILSDKAAKLINGKMHYASAKGGPFHIISRTIDGKVVSDFYIQDPTKIRSTDGKEPAYKSIKTAKDVQIAIPYNPSIHSLELGAGKELKKVNISEKIRAIQ